jgi:hypothetical protein
VRGQSSKRDGMEWNGKVTTRELVQTYGINDDLTFMLIRIYQTQ